MLKYFFFFYFVVSVYRFVIIDVFWKDDEFYEVELGSRVYWIFFSFVYIKDFRWVKNLG